MVPAGSLVAKLTSWRRRLGGSCAARHPAALPAAARQAAPACRQLRRRAAAVAGALRWRRRLPADASRRDRRSDTRCRHREYDCRRDPNRPVAANRQDGPHRSPPAGRRDGRNAGHREKESGPWASVRRGPNKPEHRPDGHSAGHRAKESGLWASARRGPNKPEHRPDGHSADRQATTPDRAAAARLNSARSAPRHLVQCVEIGGARAAAFIDRHSRLDSPRTYGPGAAE